MTDLNTTAPAPVATVDPELGDIARGLLGLPPQDKAALHKAKLPAWRIALNEAIATDPAGKQGVALRLGVSRPYVSRVTTGHIPVAPERFIERVRTVYMQVDCPHLQRTLPPAECATFAARNYADVGADGVDHWRACRRCPNNPVSRAAALGLPKPAGAATVAAAADAAGDPA